MSGLAGALLLALAGGLATWLLATIAVEMDGHHERSGDADVAVVLGSRVRPDGRPSARLAARLQRGLQVWRDRRAPAIIVSGGSEGGMNEARAMKRWLVEHGVPELVVIEDPHGLNPWETARFTRAWLARRGGRAAIAVSQCYHLPRCRLAFHRFGIERVPTAGPRFYEWRDLYAAPREVLGQVKYALRPAPGRAGAKEPTP